MTGPTRRTLLASGAGAALAAGLVPVAASGRPAGPEAPVPFRGARQAGIVTPAQDRLHFVALDVTTTDRAAFRDLLTRWTVAAERMTRGLEAEPGGLVGGGPHAAPADTGEAYDLPPSGLTITIGFGPSLFDGRLGLASRRPAPLADLPAFRGDDLEPSRCGGDLALQACANDPQVAVHAIRNLVRLGFGTVAVRWSQLGFGRTSATTATQTTPRNLFGFKDGTANLRAEEAQALEDHVWVAPEDVPGAAGWLAGGTYLVARRIRMHIETWDRTPLAEQERVFGRDKRVGAPLGRRREEDEPDLTARAPDGEPVLAEGSHVRLAHHTHLRGVRILRRGYNFTDGSDGLGHLDAGLFFLAFMRDPNRQFVPMQRALAAGDLLNEYVEHTGSAVFACPPGLAPGEDWATRLLD